MINHNWRLLGYKYRGGFNIPLRRSFTIRTADKNINLHVFKENDPEIELNILFKNHLHKALGTRDEYALLKYKLIAEEFSHEKNNSIYRGYNLGKHDFIQNILKKSGFNKYRFVLCTHTAEWVAAKHFRDIYFLALTVLMILTPGPLTTKNMLILFYIKAQILLVMPIFSFGQIKEPRFALLPLMRINEIKVWEVNF